MNVLGDIFIPSGTANSKVVQKVTSTDKAIPKFNGTNGDIQNSGVTIDDNNLLLAGSSTSSGSIGAIGGSTGATITITPSTSSGANGVTYNTSFVTGGNGGHIFSVGGTERMRIDSNGNLGIGITPSAWAAYKVIQTGYSGVLSGSNSVNELTIGSNFYNSSTGWKYINNGYASQQQFVNGTVYWNMAPSGTAGNAISWTNAMTLDSVGNLSTNNTILPYSATDSYGYKQANSNGIWYGRVVPFSSDGTMLLETQYGGNGGGFRFNVDGSQKMKLNYNGNLLVGTTTDNGAHRLQVYGGISTASASYLLTSSNEFNFANAGNAPSIYINYNSSSAAISEYRFCNGKGAGIYSALLASAFTVSSDYRIKSNIKNLDSSIDSINKLRPVSYTKDGVEGIEYGLIAHEVEEVYKDLVQGTKDALDKNGNIDPQTVNYTGLIPILIKAIQELSEEIKILKTKVGE